MMVRRLVALLLLLLWAAPAAHAREATADAARVAPVKQGLRRVLARYGPTRGAYGIHVALAQSGDTVFASGAETPRIPASTLKLVTTAAAVLELGPDFEFRTIVYAGERPGRDGSVKGDIVVRGAGDPSLRSDDHIPALARRVRAAGVRRVHGNLVIDDSIFDRVLRHPDWPRDQLSRSYSAPVSALSVDRGCVLVRVFPGAAPGARASVRLVPECSALSMKHSITTTSNRREHRIVLEVDLSERELRGRGKAWVKSTGYETEIAVPDPARQFGAVLRAVLQANGVEIDGTVVRGGGDDGTPPVVSVLAETRTSLLSVIEVTNRESQNHYAECLFKLLGHLRTGEGSFEAAAAVTARLADRVNAPADQLEQRDGSGLSRKNRVSPYYLTRVLSQVYRSPHAEGFLGSLASGGDKEGTLSRRLADLSGNVRAKTGTIRGVSGLAGYVRSESGRTYCFAVLVNDPRTPLSKARKLQDEVCRVLHRER